MAAAQTHSSTIQLKDVVIGCVVAAVVTCVNIVGGLHSGLSTLISYDPIGNLVAAQDLQNNISRMILAPFRINSGLWIALTSALLRFVGDDLWTYYLMLFWHSAILLTISAWVGRYWASVRGVIFFVSATSLLSPLTYTLVTPVRTLLQPSGVAYFIWPSIPGVESEPWGDWVNAVLKPDLLAGALVALAITLIALGPSNITRGRFVASGLAISLAVMAKGHFMPVYLLGWGAAIVVTSVCLKDEGPAYALRSYWALVTMGPLLIVWMSSGAFKEAVNYILSSYSHPLHDSDQYQQPLLGLWFYFYAGADVIGFSGYVVLGVAFAGLVFCGGKISLALKSALPFFAAAVVMAVPVMSNPFGKNFPNALPIFVSLWITIIVFCGCILFTARPSRFISFLVTLSCSLSLALVAAGVVAVADTIHNKSEMDDVRRDRETLHNLAQEIIDRRVKSVVTPNTGSGMPSIIFFEVRKLVMRSGKVMPNIFYVYWNPNTLDGNDAGQSQVRNQILSSDAVLVIPGGPKTFPFLGDHLAHVYELTESIVSSSDSPFVLAREFSLGPTTATWLYFPAGDHKMLIRLYIKPHLNHS
jgi:hypothetical protein